MIRLVLVSSLILFLGFYEAKGESNEHLLMKDEAHTPYQSFEEKWVELPPYGRVVEGKFEGSKPSFWNNLVLDIKFIPRLLKFQKHQRERRRRAEWNAEYDRKKEQELAEYRAALGIKY
ncbi:uncharacterized protein LOC128991184 [Macrosteles quadrilineatus]|uniref:uncharacterized protein LOC128988362 n=1 Tax=Macrosteles quadrilineatus TaxID=74068 RepID=UPI0023E26F31|nr:uncharacterized protein LOC128988362 [Macrosteles quadrilineatus]XP_054269942.1 uncharacterized protein LOC128991184 [Macrosteles quadrilineatus]